MVVHLNAFSKQATRSRKMTEIFSDTPVLPTTGCNGSIERLVAAAAAR